MLVVKFDVPTANTAVTSRYEYWASATMPATPTWLTLSTTSAVAGPVTTITGTISSLTYGTGYNVQVRAVSTANAPGIASTVMYAIPVTNAAAPSLSLRAGDASFTLTIVDSATTGGGTVTGRQYSTDNVNWVNVPASNIIATQTSTGNPALVNGTTYSIYARTITTSGSSTILGLSSPAVFGMPTKSATAPTLSSATPGDKSLTPVFTAPTSNGGSTITRYEYDIDNQQRWSTLDLINFNLITTETAGGFVSTIAGQARIQGSTEGTSASFNSVTDVARDASGNLYVADSGNHTIRRITPAGVTSTLAGLAGNAGTANGIGAVARFNSPQGIAIDSAGLNLYVTDTNNHTIRQIVIATGNVTTPLGSAGISGTTNATGSLARFNSPTGIARYISGNDFLLVADTANHSIRRINLSTLAVGTFSGPSGLSASGYVENTAVNTSVRFSSPRGVACDSAGTFAIVADYGNHVIRKLTSTGLSWASTAFAGAAGTVGSADGTPAAARFNYPTGVAVDALSNVYVADMGNNLIRKIGSTSVITLSGLAGVVGLTNGAGSAATFYAPYGISCTSAGVLYVADRDNHIIRSITAPGIALVNGTGYVLAIRAVNAGGPGASSNTLTAIPGKIPSAPQSVTIKPADKGLDVTYLPPANNGGYVIKDYQYAITTVTPIAWSPFISLPSNGVIVSTTAGNSPLVNGTAYYVRFRAVNNIGGGTVYDSSATPLSFTPSARPAAPTYTLTPGDNLFTLSAISPDVGAAGIIRHEYSIGASDIWSIFNNTTKTITNTYLADSVSGKPTIGPALVNGVNYDVRLRSVNSASYGPETVYINVSPGKQSNAPTGLVATIYSNSVSVAFTPPADTGGYPVINYEYSAVTPVTGADNWQARNDFGANISNNTSPIRISGLAVSTAYRIKLRAVTSYLTSPKGLPATLTPDATTVPSPSAVQSMTLTAGNQKLLVKFTAPASAGAGTIASYRYILTNVTLSTVGGIITPSPTGSPLQFFITGLTNTQRYSVTLWAVNSLGAEGVRATAGPTVVNDYVPTVTLGTITPTTGNIPLRFSATTDTTLGTLIASYSYRSYVATATTLPAWTTVPITQAATISNQLVNIAATAGTYYASVKVTTAAGVDSAAVTSAIINVPGTPITMQAPLVVNAPGYNYAPGVIGATGALRVAVTRPNLLSQADAGNSTVSKYTIVPYISGTPQAPIDLYAVVGATGANNTLKIGVVAGATGYYIDVNSTNSPSFSLGSSYTFTAYATNVAGGVGAASPLSSPAVIAAAPIIPNAAPTITANGTVSFSLTFNATAGNSGAFTFYRRGTVITGYRYAVYQKYVDDSDRGNLVATGTAAASDAPGTITLATSASTIRPGMTITVYVYAQYQGYSTATTTVLTTQESLPAVGSSKPASAGVPTGYSITSATLGSYNTVSSSYSVNITWIAGLPNSDSTNYQYTVDNGQNWVNLPVYNLTGATTTVVSTLDSAGAPIANGSFFRVGLRAVNGTTIYASFYSAATVFVPVDAPEAPAQPVQLSVISDLNTSNYFRIISFTAGANNGSTILSYRLDVSWEAVDTVAAGYYSFTVPAAAFAVNYVFTNPAIPDGVLMNGLLYAINAVGSSPPLYINNIVSRYMPPTMPSVVTLTKNAVASDDALVTNPPYDAATQQYPPTASFAAATNNGGASIIGTTYTYEIKQGSQYDSTVYKGTVTGTGTVTFRFVDPTSTTLSHIYYINISIPYNGTRNGIPGVYTARSGWIPVTPAIPTLPYAVKSTQSVKSAILLAVGPSTDPVNLNLTRNKSNGTSFSYHTVKLTPYTALTGGTIALPGAYTEILDSTGVDGYSSGALYAGTTGLLAGEVYSGHFTLARGLEGSPLTTGTTTTYAGTGDVGTITGLPSVATFKNPQSLYYNSASSELFLCDTLNYTVRVLTDASSGIFVGALNVPVTGYWNATGTAALLGTTSGIIRVGNIIYVVDRDNHAIRAITLAGAVSTFAGALPTYTTNAVSNFNASINASGTNKATLTLTSQAKFPNSSNDTTFSFAKAVLGLNAPSGLFITALASGAPGTNGSTYTLNRSTATATASTSMSLTTYFGVPGYVDATGTAARFNTPSGITTDGTHLYVGDVLNRLIRKINIATGVVTTVAGRQGVVGTTDGASNVATFTNPIDLAYRAIDNSLLVLEYNMHVVRKIDLTNNIVTTIAGLAGDSGTADGAGTTARFNRPCSIAISPTSYSAFITDQLNHTIRRLIYSTENTVSTIAGSPEVDGFADDPVGGLVQFNFPSGITYVSEGVLYVSDQVNQRIRKVMYGGISRIPKDYYYQVDLTATNSVGNSATYTLGSRIQPTP